jgi:hypothetical protein
LIEEEIDKLFSKINNCVYGYVDQSKKISELFCSVQDLLQQYYKDLTKEKDETKHYIHRLIHVVKDEIYRKICLLEKEIQREKENGKPKGSGRQSKRPPKPTTKLVASRRGSRARTKT